MSEVLLEDEHEVPSQLGERVPIIPLLWPFDWTQRQFLWFALCLWMGSTLIPEARSFEQYLPVLGYFALGVAGVIVEYVVRPTPEFWLAALAEYVALLLVSLPLWWKRLLPLRGNVQATSWPLATMPMWLGRMLVHNVEVLNDGVIRMPRPLGRKARFAVVLRLAPRPHPDMLPMLIRQATIQTRLNIFKHIQGNWSLHLEVQPFDANELEVASGPAWEWVRDNMASAMVLRRPSLVIYGKKSEDLLIHADAILRRCHQASMSAWRLAPADARRVVAELWGELGIGIRQRVRIGMRRVVAGQRSYRSWALTTLPRVIHLAWLRPLTSESLLCSLAIHVSVRRPGPSRRSLTRKLRQWRAIDRDEDYALAVYDARRVISDLRRNVDTDATVGLYVTAYEEQAREVAEALESAQCEFTPADLRQHRALRATRPLGGDPFGRTMQADLRTVATTDLLATAGYWPDGAILIGEALSCPEPIGINPFDDASNMNWATFVACMQGSGKTTLAHTLAWRMANLHPEHVLAETGVQIVSVDFKASGDYANLYHHLAARGHVASYNAWTTGKLPTIEGHMGFNLSDVPEDQRGDKLLELTQRIEDWAAVHSIERPMLLILDEILALLDVPGGPAFLRKYGTQSRSLNLAPVFCTQDVEAVLANDMAALAFKNCGHVFLGRQNPAGINAMVPLLSLDPYAQVLLASAPQGGGLLRVERKDGPVVLGVQVRPTDWELREFGTNPAERRARWQRERAAARNGHVNGKEGTNGVSGVADHAGDRVLVVGHG